MALFDFRAVTVLLVLSLVLRRDFDFAELPDPGLICSPLNHLELRRVCCLLAHKSRSLYLMAFHFGSFWFSSHLDREFLSQNESTPPVAIRKYPSAKVAGKIPTRWPEIIYRKPHESTCSGLQGIQSIAFERCRVNNAIFEVMFHILLGKKHRYTFLTR
mmetsp:Transcript_14872/g.41412  ORF Transcript_14872/g.41412 Transcript_14872/m.41412 type:complete len:159 (-) Transcript_14872:4737-5213(-)